MARFNVGITNNQCLLVVFLRVLEYYNGVLFLTTNRVGTIDEAFKSRIHLSLYYPPLTIQQTLDIFEVNLRRLREIEAAKAAARADADQNDPGRQPDLEIIIDHRRIMRFAEDHYDTHRPSQNWNGRQIRNAFQVAYSLAQSHMHNADRSDDESADDTAHDGKTKATKFTLDDEQFRIVSKSIERFDEYLKLTRGEDGDRARQLHLRNDEFGEEAGRMAHTPMMGRPEPPRRQPGYGGMPKSDHVLMSRQDYGPTGMSRMDYPPTPRRGGSRHSPRPSVSGVSDVDLDDKVWEADQARNRKRRSAPQKGGSTLPIRSPLSSTHLSPDSPVSRRDRDLELASQALSNSEEYSDDDTMSHRGSVGGGAAKYHGRDRGYGEHVRRQKY